MTDFHMHRTIRGLFRVKYFGFTKLGFTTDNYSLTKTDKLINGNSSEHFLNSMIGLSSAKHLEYWEQTESSRFHFFHKSILFLNYSVDILLSFICLYLFRYNKNN